MLTNTKKLQCALAVVGVFIATGADAQTGARNFQMSSLHAPARNESDFAVFTLGEAQPASLSYAVFPFIASLDGDATTAWSQVTNTWTYDFDRIVAIYVDEPYLNVGPSPSSNGIQNPCTRGATSADDDPRCPTVANIQARLQLLADAAHEQAPQTRFWVNFSEPELIWMSDPSANTPSSVQNTGPQLALVDDAFDVLSLDKYNTDFPSGVQPLYEQLIGLKSASQQLALVPGVFVRTNPGATGAVAQPQLTAAQKAEDLANYFAFASQLNQDCNQPLGPLGLTGRFDGCEVWIVAGWPGADFDEGAGNYYHSLYDDAQNLTAPILAAWDQEFTLPTWTASSTGPSRKFQMALMRNAPVGDGELPQFLLGSSQPEGRSYAVFPFPSADWEQATAGKDYDFARIAAILVDEPYRNVGTSPTSNDWQNPCSAGDARCADVDSIRSQLQALASAIHGQAPSTRFWVNFSEPEVQWMGMGTTNSSPPLALIDGSIDVVSVDKYEADFATAVQPYYDFLVAHRASAGQQLALMPGLFVATSPGATGSVVSADGVTQASYLAGYFSYASQMNQSCDWPLGNLTTTGNFDGCPVWLVAGWPPSSSNAPGGPYFHAITDDARGLTSPIAAAWRRQAALRPIMPFSPAFTAAFEAALAPLFM